MSLLQDYFRETQTKEIIEDERGFATYYFINEGVYVEDMFIRFEYRKKGIAKEYLDNIANIAKAKGCTKMFGSCVPSSKTSTDSLGVAFSCGFKLLYSKENFITYVKDL